MGQESKTKDRRENKGQKRKHRTGEKIWDRRENKEHKGNYKQERKQLT